MSAKRVAPLDSWYAAASSEEIGRFPIGRRVLDTPIVLYRNSTGDIVALADRCAHRPVRLSDGRVNGDEIVAPYTGFRYAADGRCVCAPTQANVPYGASVRAYPAQERDGLIWVWPGRSALAELNPAPQAPWLADSSWTTIGSQWLTSAGLALFHDDLADITHVANVDPELAPPALSGPPPPLQIQVSDTSVSFWRSYDKAPLAPWHAELLMLPLDAEHAHREEGEFVSPGLWVDRWITTVSGHGDRDGEHTFIFTHALTPIDARTTQHIWRVSRSFTPSAAATAVLQPLMTDYYQRMKFLLEGMQATIDLDGEQRPVSLTVDAAGTAVRRIMARLVRAGD